MKYGLYQVYARQLAARGEKEKGHKNWWIKPF